jgi:hypothetical protein
MGNSFSFHLWDLPIGPLWLLIPSQQFHVDEPHAEVLILGFLSLVLLVRLATELVKLLRCLSKLTREFLARGREPIVIPPHDAQLQAVVVEANASSRVSSRTVEIMGKHSTKHLRYYVSVIAY